MSQLLAEGSLEEQHWKIQWDNPKIYWMDYCEDFYIDEIRDFVSSFPEVERKIREIKSISDEERDHMINHIHARIAKPQTKGEGIARRAEA